MSAPKQRQVKKKQARPDLKALGHKMAIVVGDPYKMKTEEVLKEFFAKIAEERGYQRRPYTNEMAQTNKVTSLFRRYKRH